MAVIVTEDLVLTDGDEIAFGLTGDHPIIGWDNIVTVDKISAEASDISFPVSNMANPATHLVWKAEDDTGQDITIVTGTADPLDYVAIARHNLGTTGTSVEIGYLDTSSPPAFVALTTTTILSNDGPALFRFTAQSISTIVVRLGDSDTADPAQIAVMYAGKLLVLPRKVYQGFAPIPYGRIAKVTNGRSEAGNFLGRIVLQEFVRDTLPLSLIDPTYFRDHIADFLIDSKENPFFFAWRPETYPMEVGYCHMTNDPLPVNEAPHGLIAMQMEMTGVV